MVGDFAGCRCSSFNVSFEVKLLVKIDPKLSAGGLDSVMLICDQYNYKGSVYYAGRGVVILLSGKVYYF